MNSMLVEFLIILLVLFSCDGYLVQLTPAVAKLCIDDMKNAVSKWNSTQCGFPLVDESQSIGFLSLDASFPFNAPPNIQRKAGPEFRQGAGLHGGIGIIISSTSSSALYGLTSSNVQFTKISVEFVAENYINGLFPNTTNNKVIWNNNGAIYVRNPIDTNLWLNSKIITETNGLNYLKYIHKIFQTIATGGFEVFQPISVLTPNMTAFEAITPPNQLEIGNLLVNPTSSFTFVQNTIDFLFSENFPMGTFLELAATSAFYFHCCIGKGCLSSCSPLKLVDLSFAANQALVSSWYQKLYKCFSSLASADFQSCYGSYSYAYVYMNSSMVYNVTLLDITSYQSMYANLYNPMIFRYILEESYDYNNVTPQLEPIDIVIFILFSMMIAAIFLFVAIKYYKKRGIRSEKQTNYLDRFNDKMQDDFYYRESGVVKMPIMNNRIDS